MFILFIKTKIVQRIINYILKPISAPQRDIKSLTLGLPYVYVYNIKLVEYASKPIFFYDPLPLLDEIKKIIGEQNVDVLIVDFLDRVRIKINLDSTHLTLKQV